MSLADAPMYVIYASAAKHASDSAIYARRRALRAFTYWEKEAALREAERWQRASWDHLQAARDAKRWAS